VTDATNPATADAVVLERPLTPEETAAVPHWLDQAWTILQTRVPGIPGRLALPPGTPTALTTAAVVQVLAAMVERKVRNPDGLRGWTVDDVARTVDAALSTGQLYVTDDEVARLAVPVPSGGLFSIQLGR
jgi:hypothetical protein